MFDDLIPQSSEQSAGVFDDLLTDQPGGKILRAGGGFMTSAKQSAGSLIKGVGQAAGDFIPGVAQDNAVKQYGQEVIDANPTAVHSLSDIADKPLTAAEAAIGNAGASMAGIVGARLLGQGITAAAPLAGPAAPIVAGVGQGISLLGPYAVAALPSFGGIREQQGADNSIGAKAAAAAGAATVGVIENKFGPQEWALGALTKGGRDQLAEKFAAKTLAGSVAKGVGTGAAVEGAEELVQNPVEQLAAFQDPTTRENLADTAFSGAMGAIGGGVMGGPMAGLSHRQPQPAVVPRADGQGEVAIDPTVGPLSAAAAEHVHRGDAQSAEAATGDLFGDLAPAPLTSAIDPLVDLPESADPFADLVPADLTPTPLQDWQAEAVPVSFEEAQGLVDQARAAGYDGHAIIRHGDGFGVVPREWLNADELKASQALQPSTSGVLNQSEISTPAATTWDTGPFGERIKAVLGAYEAAGHPDHARIIHAALKGRMPTEDSVAFWEKALEKNSRTWQTIAGEGKPVQAKLRTAPDLWEGGRELAASQFVPDNVTAAVLARSNALVQQLAERGVHIDEVDSRFPADVTGIKAQESGLRGLFLRYTRQLQAQAKGYKRFDPAALAKTQAELFKEIGLTVDQAASQANTAPSGAQIAAGNYQKGHIKVGPLDIAIENPAGSTRKGPGWTTKMQDHYGYMKRTEGADGDQVDVYVKAGTPTDHSGPVFVIDQYDPATGKFDETKAMVGYRFQGAAIKAYDAHFSDGSGSTRRKGVTKMSAEQFKQWAQSATAKAPAKTESSVYAVIEPDKVSGDTPIGTEHAIPQTNRKALPRKGKAAPGRAGASSRVIAVRQAPDVEGIYHVSTQLVTVGERSLPVGRVQTWQDAANVFGNLSRYAVEHFDALVTDKKGKPLAIIGGFKGAPTQASVYPGTVMMELSRIDGAAHVWMAHNHPSGTPDLSNADRMLSGSFASILRGSNVEYHGLAAVARTGNTIAWTSTEHDNGTVSVDQPAKFKVPMVEREITESNPGAAVSSPAAAKSLVSGIAKDQPGVVFLTAQNGISAFVPFEPAEMGELRSGDRLMRLFRAASKAGATGALVAMPDGQVSPQQFANLKGALSTIDVKVLDGIEYASDGTGKVESLAEKGLDSTAGHDFLDITPALLAPNGKPSKLTKTQYAQVRTPAFKAWFGDWENDPTNASKVLDENGEPLVVFHGSTKSGRFVEFKPNERGLIWAGSERATAASYAGFDRDVMLGNAQRGILPVFLNIRNPSETSGGGKNYFELPNIDGQDFTDGFAMRAKATGHDGAIIREVIDDGGEFDTSIDTAGDDYAVFRPEQVKSATQNTGAFDPQNPVFLNDLAGDLARAVQRAIDRTPAKRGSARLQLAKLRSELESGKINEARFVTGVEKVHAMLEETAQTRKFAPLKERARGADYIRQRLLEAKRNGDIDDDAADLAEWFILKNPALVDGLGISIKTAGENEEGARGRYMPLPQIVRLFKGSAGTETAVHETLHHLERMMPAAMQDAIRLEYERRLAAAIKKGEHADYFKAILDGDFKKAGALIQTGKVPYSAYQYFNASEFWAVNMAELVSDRFAARNSMFGRIKQWLVEAVQHIKAVLGLRSDAPMIKALNELIRSGDGEITQKEMLGKSDQYLSLETVADPDKLTVRDWIGHQLSNQRSWALGALTRDQLADVYGKHMPEVSDFDRVVQEMDQARNIIAEKADAIIERWRKLPAQTADTLAGIMHSATLEQFDPDIKTRDDVATPEQSILLKDWEALPDEAKQLYRDVRDQYAATLAKLRNGLSKRAERAGAAGQRIAAEIRLQFDKYLAEGPYFPLARFGDFILIADKHEQRIVEAFESSAAREKRARQLRVTGWTTKLTAKKGYSATKDGPAGEFVGDVLKLVDGLEIEAKEKSALMDSLNQLAISALPDQSYRRHFTHRKGTTGFSQDAMRAFASSMQHVAHHVARVLHGDELTLILDSMNKRIAETAGDVDTTVQQQVANELAKRLDLMMNPTTHPVTALAGQVGFVMSLGGSVASGLTNLSQTPLITFPWLGAKFGFDKAAGALTKASKDYFGGKWDKWSGFVLKDNQALTADERRALQQLEDAGLINLTQTSDLASTATTDSASSSRSWAINRAMKIIGWTFSTPEVFNRQVSALAAYRLATEKGQTHDQAVETALETLRRTHFDYSASNRSRWMAGNFTRVVTMFKQYSQQMTYLLWRNAYQALKGESPAVRREARRMLLGVAAMHFSAAGALGLPLGVFGLSPLLGLLNMGMGEGDDPWDWEVEFRKMLADTFGKAGGEAIAHGPLRMLTNVDFASRVGLGDLWVRSPQGDKEGRDLVEAWMLTLLGPVAGYIGNIGTATKAFDEGKVGRGLESMLPKMLAAPLKAARYETEGVRSWRGDDLGVALTGGDILGTALGFQPSKLAEMFEGRAAIKGTEAKLAGRREELVNMWMAATMAGDQSMQAEAMAAAMKFNRANPTMAISADSMRRSMQAKLRNQAQIQNGTYLSKRREGLREEGRFANVE